MSLLSGPAGPTTTLVAPLGKLHFADRAVKSTSQTPHFLCLHRCMAAQSPTGSAVVTLVPSALVANPVASAVALASVPARFSASSSLAAAPLAVKVRVQLQGDAAVCVFHGRTVRFQCRGNGCSSDTNSSSSSPSQTHELSISPGDVVAMLSNVTGEESLSCLFARMGAAMAANCDLEYAAEELLLSMACAGQTGNTTLVGKVASLPSSSAREPPLSSSS